MRSCDFMNEMKKVEQYWKKKYGYTPKVAAKDDKGFVRGLLWDTPKSKTR